MRSDPDTAANQAAPCETPIGAVGGSQWCGGYFRESVYENPTPVGFPQAGGGAATV